MRALKPKTIKLHKIPSKTKKRKNSSFSKNLGISDKHLYRDLQLYRINDWWKDVKAFEANPNSVFNAYWYVAMYPARDARGGNASDSAPATG